MKPTIRTTNLRFNLEKELYRNAWEYLQTMDKQKFKSYNHVIALALVEYFNRYYQTQADPYLENREREEQFVTQIVEAVTNTLEKTLPLFLTGYITGLNQHFPTQPNHSVNISEEESEIDWDFIGE